MAVGHALETSFIRRTQRRGFAIYRDVTYTTRSLSATLDRLRKLDMEQHCKWMALGTDGLRGKGRMRMRPKLHLPVLEHAFRATDVMASSVSCLEGHRRSTAH